MSDETKDLNSSDIPNDVHSQYIRNRMELWEIFKMKEDVLCRISIEGINTPGEYQLAIAACSFLAADISFEKFFNVTEGSVLPPERLN